MYESSNARRSPSRRLVVLLPLFFLGASCAGGMNDGGGSGSGGTSTSGSAGTRGSAGTSGSTPGTAGASAGTTGSAGVGAGTAGTTGSGGTVAPTGTAGTTGGAGTGVAGTGAGGSTGTGGTTTTGTGGAGGAHTGRDHCIYGYDPEPTDATIKPGPAEFYPPGNMSPDIVDLTLQPEVLKWMTDHQWQAAHVEWHAIRTCNLPGGAVGSKVNICSFTNLVPKDQNCQTDGDGYQFLLFHRHMLQSLKQLWPHGDFEAFKRFPQTADDLPPQWRSAWKPFDAQALAAGKIGDEIDKPENLAKFPNEGVLGFWLQCNVGQKLTTPTNSMPFVGLHFLLHAKWVRTGNTTHGVNNTSVNVENYMFWKLHGWIDNVWEKYRLAKGMKPTDQKYKDDLAAQCREMDTEASIVKDKLKPGQVPDPLPIESGFFHEQVRPIFAKAENRCTGCHDAAGAEIGLMLGGNISSKAIVAQLVNVASRDGGQFKRVVPGQPDQSWLYKKITGMTTGCTVTSTGQCVTGPMPPDTMPTVSAADLAIVKQWIMDGAAGPP